jgi:hypothetical protein
MCPASVQQLPEKAEKKPKFQDSSIKITGSMDPTILAPRVAPTFSDSLIERGTTAAASQCQIVEVQRFLRLLSTESITAIAARDDPLVAFGWYGFDHCRFAISNSLVRKIQAIYASPLRKPPDQCVL